MLSIIKRNCNSRPFYYQSRLLSTAVAATRTENIRNIAIIAHVDHGKTSLVDCLLKQSGTLDASKMDINRVMDSNALEIERGITILSKCTSIVYKNYRINIVDTPGHSDFGGEVERALTMVDGVVLVVDATEGPMAQTKIVLSKAIQRGLIPLVVLNKVDRDTRRCAEVNDELVDLFLNLNCNDAQFEYPTIYASAKEGWSSLEGPPDAVNGAATSKTVNETKPEEETGIETKRMGMETLFEEIVKRIPPPPPSKKGDPFKMMVNSIEFNSYIGKCLLGKIHSGSIKVGDKVKILTPKGEDSVAGEAEEGRVSKISVRHGMVQVFTDEAVSGDIVSLSGLSGAMVNDTIASLEAEEALPIVPIDPPTIAMNFMVNSSPLAGSEGKSFTKETLLARIRKEIDNNVSMKMDITSNDDIKVYGRGELQLGILIETIRREGFEMAVSPPQVLFKKEGGKLMEPFEEVIIDSNLEYQSLIIDRMSKRQGELISVDDSSPNEDMDRMIFKCPTRGLIGFANELKNETKGTALMTHSFLDYEAKKGSIERIRKGSLISMTDGITTAHALADLEPRGTLFIPPNTKVYSGMVIGEGNRGVNLEVNPSKMKVLTNFRTTTKDEYFRMAPIKQMCLEEFITYMQEDEILEVTPKSIRLRKSELDSNARKRMKA